MNQSPNNVYDLLFFKEAKQAEHYLTIAKYYVQLGIDMGRLYGDGTCGELCPEGVPSGVFIKFILVSDKPFIRHEL